MVVRISNALGLKTVARLVDAAPLALPLFDIFEFAGIDMVLPTRIFEDRLSLKVGDRRVELMDLGPAHTLGDTVVYLPDDRVLFTGDLLFKDAHPLIWQGPVSNWISACRVLLELEVDVVVPGHGPLCGAPAVAAMLDYVQDTWARTIDHLAQGHTADEAAADTDYLRYAEGAAERYHELNIRTVYAQLAGGDACPI